MASDLWLVNTSFSVSIVERAACSFGMSPGNKPAACSTQQISPVSEKLVLLTKKVWDEEISSSHIRLPLEFREVLVIQRDYLLW